MKTVSGGHGEGEGGGSLKNFGCGFLVSGAGLIMLAEIENIEVGVLLKKSCSNNLLERKVRVI